ncbi:MAG: hypothetical protein AVDCRST_MAG95-3398 [uncultured Adhaeribacter sp.]|uniref:Uncharacterized protein n=1 Tax=uncultured Adhaeribacter sp. TaxID=448109 RepID=A0A6J4JML8_9BACT|nr:MAG: hypothetical protein AVDCRST_MAG95-3398 [uncultured Adhaeribacter sp.]
MTYPQHQTRTGIFFLKGTVCKTKTQLEGRVFKSLVIRIYNRNQYI